MMNVFREGAVVLEERINDENWIFSISHVLNLSDSAYKENQAYNYTLGDYEPGKERPTCSMATISAKSDSGRTVELLWSSKSKKVFPHISRIGWTKGVFVRLNTALSQWKFSDKIKETLRAIYSDDIHQAWLAAWEILRTDNNLLDLHYVPEIERIRLAVSKLPMPERPYLRDSRDVVKLALNTIEARSQERCRCSVYTSTDQLLPESLAGYDLIVILEKKDIPWAAEFNCKCIDCGEIYFVKENRGYHYPAAKWVNIKSDVAIKNNVTKNMRNKLALERTRLANERTFLAYVRTGLSLLAAAVVLLEFFRASSSYSAVAYMLGGSGLVVLFVGIFRFRKVRKDLKESSLADINNEPS